MTISSDRVAGREEQVIELGEITKLMIQRYAVAVGDLNPLYFDDAHARACGYPGIIAPPNFLPAVQTWTAGSAEAELAEDGTELAIAVAEIAGMRLMGGGQELTFGRPVRPGAVVTARRRLVDLYQREGRRDVLLFAVSDIIYEDQHGEHLMTCRETMIAAP